MYIIPPFHKKINALTIGWGIRFFQAKISLWIIWHLCADFFTKKACFYQQIFPFKIKILYDWVLGVCLSWYKSSALARRRDKHTPDRTNKLQENERKSNASFAADPLGESTQFFFDIQKFSFYALNRNCYFPIGNVYAFFRLSAQRKDNLHL